jgi:hypothetical protein
MEIEEIINKTKLLTESNFEPMKHEVKIFILSNIKNEEIKKEHLSELSNILLNNDIFFIMIIL